MRAVEHFDNGRAGALAAFFFALWDAVDPSTHPLIKGALVIFLGAAANELGKRIARRLRAPRLLVLFFERLSGPPATRDELPPARPRLDSHSHDRRTNRAKDRDRPSRPD